MEEQRGPGNRPGDVDDDPAAATGAAGSTPSMATRWGRLPGSVRAVAAAVVGAVLGITIWQWAHPAPTAPRPTAARSSTVPTSNSALLVAEQVCTSFEGGILEVTFQVVNVGRQPARVVAVRPDLPMGMLRTLGSDLDNGQCGRGGAAPAGGLLAVGASIPVTFRLLPLVDCPQPAPVAADVDVAVDSPATVSVSVLPDLGSVDFPSCATASSSP